MVCGAGNQSGSTSVSGKTTFAAQNLHKETNQLRTHFQHTFTFKQAHFTKVLQKDGGGQRASSYLGFYFGIPATISDSIPQ